MNDHINPDKVRELANLHRKWGEEVAWAPKIKNTHTQIAEILESLLAPPPPTLADLIEEGHDPARYQWMQAEHRDERCIIIRVNSQAFQPTVSLLTATGATIWTSTDEVIPLPDLPCLVWPASEPEDDVAYATGGALTTQGVVDECRAVRKERGTPEVAPKVLTTVRDYEQAAKGTVVFGDAVREKSSDGLWYMPGWEPGRTSKQMRDIPRKIIYMPEVQA